MINPRYESSKPKDQDLTKVQKQRRIDIAIEEAKLHNFSKERVGEYIHQYFTEYGRDEYLSKILGRTDEI